MTDEFNTNAEVGIDVSKAVAALNRLISGLADVQTSSPQAAKALETLERQAVQIVQSLNKGTTAVKGQAAAIESLISQYNRLGVASLKNAGKVQKELQSAFSLAGQKTSQKQNDAFASYSPNIAASAAIQKQYDEQVRYAKQANQQMLRDSDTARQAELSALRSSIQEKYKLQDQASQAQLRYAAEAARAGTKYGKEVRNDLSNQRYALYDVATTWGVVSAATIAAAAISTKIAVDFEKNFATVKRTVGGTAEQMQSLRADLIDLSTSLPTSFADITAIAALGGQLGIGASGIEQFTEVVAKLTATTNLSAEAAGTALGRFQSLLDVPSSQFENLGSAILKVGVNSVATESQIVSTATQISSMGEFAGLSADQVIGLSGALASVGTQPELSRGTVTRVFTTMSKAIAAGGDQLNEFARLSGVSADQFRAAWRTDQFASVFQGFLKGISSEGNNSVKTLNELGISSQRDVPLLLRLASSQGVVTQAFNDAAVGFRDGTELNKQYAITAGTVAAKLTILGNSFKALIEAPSSGALGPIAGIVDLLTDLANGLRLFASTDVGKVLGIIALSALGLIGALTGLRAMQALVTASSYAMTIAYRELNGTALAARTGLTGLVGQMAALAVGTTRATAAQEAYNAALAAGNGRVGAVAAGARAGAVAVNGLAGAFRTAMIAAGWLAVIGIGISVLTSFAQKNQEADAAVDGLTDSLDVNTGAITENTRAQVFDALVKDGTIDRAKRLGLSLDLVTDAAMGNTAAINTLRDGLSALNNEDVTRSGGAFDADTYNRVRDSAEDYRSILSSVGVQSGRVADAQSALNDQLSAGVGASGDIADEAANLSGELQDLLDTQYEVIGGTVGVQNALYALGSSLGENGASFDAYSVAGRQNLAALQSALSAMVTASGGDAAALATMVAGLMQSLASYGVDTVNQLAYVQSALAQLTGGKGVAGLASVQNAAAQAGNALGQGFSSGAGKAAKSVSKAGKSAGGAAKEIKTLSDYVSDLKGVFSSAFDIRFGLETSIDSVSEAYAKLSEYAADAADAVNSALGDIRDADAEIRSLNAANTTLGYQLTVAQDYGDTLRANEILAEMADNNAKIASQEDDRTKSSKDLSKAQAALNKSLDGSTEGSREQRDMVLTLVKSYQDQVVALANSGLSQQEVARRTQELKNQFIAQLTQMGYNRAEVDRYATAFDDLTLAILRVPRNITVNADTSPAQRAIDEFLAKNANRQSNVGVGLNVPDGGSTYGLGQQAGAAYADGWNVAVNARRKLVTQQDASLPGGVRYSTDGGRNWFLKRGGEVGSGVQYHSTGGVHGLGFKPRGTDTTPAMLTPGEFVQQRQAVKYYGLPYMNALNNMQIPRYLGSGGSASRSTPSAPNNMIQLVELLPNQLSQLAQMVSTHVSLDGKIVAEATNNVNATSARRGSN
jgi:TP901 family phage tail tape measure protein